jgi:hypothetical protein
MPDDYLPQFRDGILRMSYGATIYASAEAEKKSLVGWLAL